MRNKKTPLSWLEVRWKENPALVGVQRFDNFNEAVIFGLCKQKEFNTVDLFACFKDGGECRLKGVVENGVFAE